ncbi:plastocyanin/azurin family copper-binding protein [Membranihabitans maritimus]|uniref:plastocyanin/azurin family copper-binding protein n=1 Tax=Membranihabitans maritimus TaxID=2904244 RepID=UPI001F006C9E|nr:plastocyanin/azurin family copper-binding protein [Membranihabitans maritimus]
MRGLIIVLGLMIGSLQLQGKDYRTEGIARTAVDTQVVELGVLQGQMKYDKAEITVQSGQPVAIVFKNNDIMLHNILILKPGTTDKVGMAADKMVSQPDAQEKGYVPEMEEILYSSPLVNPGATYRLKFTAPKEKGMYPFICTFPGHWRIMQGVLKVE